MSSDIRYRKSLPKALKDRLWDITFGQNAGEGKCDVCDTIINSKRFEAGHIKSVYYGGSTTLDNLKCICSTCNKSMGTQNLKEFKKTYFPAICNMIKKQNNKCNCCCHDTINDVSQIIPKNELKSNIINNDNDEIDDDDEINKNKLNIRLNEIFNKYLYIQS